MIELDNTTVFTPDADYEPATKKHVDDNTTATIYSVGDNALGGVVFYVTDGGRHGLVAAKQDQYISINWYYAHNELNNPSNHDSEGDKYTDWRLPSKFELNMMYNNRITIGSFASSYYWSSTEYNNYYAWGQIFIDGSQYYANKDSPYYVRAVRAF